MNQQRLDAIRRSAAAKLERVLTSAFLYSLFGYLVGERWSDPPVLELACDSDDNLCVRESGLPFLGQTLCPRSAFVRAVLDVAEQVNLTPAERAHVLQRIPAPKSKVFRSDRPA